MSVDHKQIFEIAAMMLAAGLPGEFVSRAASCAAESEGFYELMLLWSEATGDVEEQEACIAALQENIDECEERPRVLETAPVSFERLDEVVQSVCQFKQDLKKKVDAWGGVPQLSVATGIPQPSLSHFFSSAARPRRNTLYKIAKAVGLTEHDIVCAWAV